MQLLACLCFLIATLPCYAQVNWNDSVFGPNNPNCYVQKDFLVIQSTENYEFALRTAQQAAEACKLKLDLEGLVPVVEEENGVPPDTTFYRDTMFYMYRGRNADGIYISIEYSNAYDNFEKGYYLVVAGSGLKNDKELIAALNKMRTKYPDAFIKTSKVYMCCMH